MYNIDFLPQLGASKRHLFGNLESRDRIYNYVLPKDLTILECEEDSNGEWVPKKALEKRTEPVK